MTSDYAPSVTRRHGYDYWRTWFLEECEAASLLGVTAEQLPLITTSRPGRSPYRPGTELYLEDAPWFPHSGGKTHRIAGPYVVKATRTLPDHAESTHDVDGQIVVYRDLQPERGPWHNRTMVQRLVDGEIVLGRQIAGQFDHFPYRVRIVRTPRWHIQLVRHSDSCWLC